MRIKNRNKGYGNTLEAEITDNGIRLIRNNSIPYGGENSSSKNNYIPFSSVKKFEITVSTSSYTYKGSTTTQILGMSIVIVTDDASYHLNSRCSMRILYNVLKYKKFINNFKVYVDGPSDGVDVPLKIYSMTGIKLLLRTSNAVTTCTVMSFMCIFILCMIISPLFFEEGARGFTETLPVALMMTAPISVVGFVCSGLIVYNEYLKHKVKRMLNL